MRGGRTRAPTARDYAAQQNLREECVKWLQDRPQLTGWHAGMDAVSNSRRQSSWSDAAIKNLEGGKQSTSDNMGVYANEAALRAMAGLRKEPLVVVDSRAGPSLSRQVFAIARQTKWRCMKLMQGQRISGACLPL